MPTQHPVNQQPEPGNSRASRYAHIERTQGEEGSHPATRAAIQRVRESRSGRRVQEFLRIARGREV